MVTGLAFVLLAVLLTVAVSYYVLLERNRSLALLDRRIASVSLPIAETIRLRVQMRIPDFIAPLLARAQIEPTLSMVLATFGVFGLIFLAALMLAGATAALAMAVLPTAMLIFYIRQRARANVDLLIESLPFYLDGVRQLLMVGGSLPQALVRGLPAASKELQSFIGPAARRIELGAPVTESMQMLAESLRVPELSMLVAAIRVNLRFGGPMATVLANLANILRERLRIRRELRSATAEVKMSTRVLIALPIAVVAFLFVSNRAYFDFFLHEPRGHMLATVAIMLQLSGMLIMRHLMRMRF